MDALSGVFSTFLNYLFQSGAVYVPDDYHSRCSLMDTMMDDDVIGIVSTITKYAINSAAEAKFQIECADKTVEDLLNQWMERINISLEGIPTGLQELAKEYYKERWAGSSLCLLRYGKWEKITSGTATIEVPTTLWFVRGGSVYIKRPNSKNFKLGTDKYFLDEEMKEHEIPKGQFVLQKPFNRWFDKYSSPYNIQNGVYKNWKALAILQDKSDEVIAKFLPYLLQMKKGTLEGYKEGIKYDDKDMKLMVDIFKETVEKYHGERGKVPVAGLPFDQSFEHLIPDLKNILNEEIYNQGSRAILTGLGFVDVIQGISSTRKESVLNPKPFIAEVNAGVDGFKLMLMELIREILDKNKQDHRKLFSGKNPLRIVNNPLRINVENIIDSLRSAFVYGTITIETFQEMLGIDPDKELERMIDEWKVDPKTGVNLRELFYPHITQNTEDKGIDTELNPPAPAMTKKQLEKQNEKTKGTKELFVKCSECGDVFDFLSVSEAGMGYVKCPKCGASVDQSMIAEEAEQIINEPIDPNLPSLEIAPYKNLEELLKHQPSLKKYTEKEQRLWMHVWNSVYEQTKDEARAFSAAWAQLKKYIKRHSK